MDAAIGLILLPAGCVGVLGEAYMRTNLADADKAQQSAFPPTTKLLTVARVRELEKNGIVVIPNALSPKALALARLDVSLSRNRFDTSDNDRDVRQDVVQWIRATSTRGDKNDNSDNDDCGPGLLQAIRLIRGVGHALDIAHYCKANDLRVPQDCQLASYPGNGSAGYKQHLDRCTSTLTELGLLEYWRLSDFRGRVITVILYLNPADRTRAEGGILRCTDVAAAVADDDDDHEAFFDIEPKGGSMVVFDASRIRHQVLPSSSERTAITCWINGALDEVSPLRQATGEST
jgi:2OG-Fe(II) oxygenase superfamily